MYIHINSKVLEAFNNNNKVMATLVLDNGDFEQVEVIRNIDGTASILDPNAPKASPYETIVAPRKSNAKVYVPSNALFDEAIEKAIKGDMNDIYVVDEKRVYKGKALPVTFYVTLKQGYARGTKEYEAYEPHFVYRQATIGDPLEVK